MSFGPDSLKVVTRAKHDAFMKAAALAGLDVRGTQYTRTMDEQLHLWAQGRQLQGGVWVVVKRSAIVTKARPGSSAHNFGYGFDICFRGADPYLHAYEVENGGASDPRWEQAGELMESVGLAWGGRWKSIKDRPHAEEPSWKVLSGSFT